MLPEELSDTCIMALTQCRSCLYRVLEIRYGVGGREESVERKGGEAKYFLSLQRRRTKHCKVRLLISAMFRVLDLLRSI